MKYFLQILFFFLLVTQICFAQWYQQNSLTTQNLNAIVFTDANNGIAVGDSGTILRTDNGGNSWTSIPRLTLNDFSSVLFTDPNIGWAVTGHYIDAYNPPDSSVVIHTTDGGLTWNKQITVPSSVLNDIFFFDNNTGLVVGYLSGNGAIILRTTNGGLTWNQQIIGTMRALIKINFVDSNNGWIIDQDWFSMGGGSKIYKTTDGGMSWYQQFETQGGSEWSSVYLNDISFADLNNGIACGIYFNGWFICGIIASTTDGGENWSYQDNIPLYYGFRDVLFLNDNTFAMLGQGQDSELLLYWTTDGGANWSIRPSGMNLPLMNCLFFTDVLTGWAVGENGTILHTTNGGTPVELTSFTATANGKEVILNWSTATELNNQLFEVQRSFEGSDFATVGFVNGKGTTTERQDYSYSDEVFTNGKYSYRLKQIDYLGSYEYSDVVEIDFRTFNSYLLEQNFPNPFNPTTTIGFGIQNKSKVKITILNSIGEEVAVVLNEEREAGFHQVEFNAANLPSGVYFYRLQAGSFIETKKMVLIK